MQENSLELAGVEIPGPVVLAYMIAFFGPLQVASPKQMQSLAQPPIPKETWKANIRRVQVPVVCGRCLVVQGSMEGGRLNADCWRCSGSIQDRDWWARLGTVSNMVGELWATDALACLIIKEVLDIRSTIA